MDQKPLIGVSILAFPWEDILFIGEQ